MAFHIVAPRPIDPHDEGLRTRHDRHPRHALAMLADTLGATLQAPAATDTGRGLDSLRARISAPPAYWGFARRLAAQLGPSDVIFCSSEEAGLQVAAVCGALPRRPRICVFVHNLDRPRGRLALRLFGLARKVDLFLACSQVQVDFLRRYLRLPANRVGFVWDHTDTSFFHPAPTVPDSGDRSPDAPPGAARPVLVSVGLENRDYRTLAAATGTLDVDVRISGFSADADALARTFPDPLPDNMERRFYAWSELAQLYRDAAAVVVSVHPNLYAAGVQSLMEGMASGRPVIATASVGLRSYLDEKTVTTVPCGDADAMRAAVQRLLADPADAARRGAEARTLAVARHGIERYVDELAGHLRALA